MSSLLFYSVTYQLTHTLMKQCNDFVYLSKLIVIILVLLYERLSLLYIIGFLLICDFAYFFFIITSNIRLWLEYNYYIIVYLSLFAFVYLLYFCCFDEGAMNLGFVDYLFVSYFKLCYWGFADIFLIWLSKGLDLGPDAVCFDL